jgi:hypothetical protein
MKSIFGILLFFLLTAFNSYGQADTARVLLNMETQADKMGQLFISGDYKAFGQYTYPKVLQMMGGVDKVAEVLTRITADMKAQGITFSKVTFDEPSKIIKHGNELQATILQHIELKLSKGRLVNTSALVAISTDKGSNWTFVDTSKKDITTLRKALPNLSPSITIPPAQQPVRYDD